VIGNRRTAISKGIDVDKRGVSHQVQKLTVARETHFDKHNWNPKPFTRMAKATDSLAKGT